MPENIFICRMGWGSLVVVNLEDGKDFVSKYLNFPVPDQYEYYSIYLNMNPKFKLSGLVKFIHCYLPSFSLSTHMTGCLLPACRKKGIQHTFDSKMLSVACVFRKILFQRLDTIFNLPSHSAFVPLFILTYSRLSSKYTHVYIHRGWITKLKLDFL